MQKYAAFGTLHHPIPVTQKNENPKLTKVQHLPLYDSYTCMSSKLAWEASLLFHVHNTGHLQINNLLHTKNAPLQFNHAIHAVNTTNRYTYLSMQGKNFSLHFTYTGVQCLWTSKHAYSFLSLKRICQLSQISGQDSYYLIRCMVSSFVHTFLGTTSAVSHKLLATIWIFLV